MAAERPPLYEQLGAPTVVYSNILQHLNSRPQQKSTKPLRKLDTRVSFIKLTSNHIVKHLRDDRMYRKFMPYADIPCKSAVDEALDDPFDAHSQIIDRDKRKLNRPRDIEATTTRALGREEQKAMGTSYGNCMQVISCDDCSNDDPFIVRVSGVNMSSVTISRLQFCCDTDEINGSETSSNSGIVDEAESSIDMTHRIYQLKCCSYNYGTCIGILARMEHSYALLSYDTTTTATEEGMSDDYDYDSSSAYGNNNDVVRTRIRQLYYYNDRVRPRDVSMFAGSAIVSPSFEVLIEDGTIHALFVEQLATTVQMQMQNEMKRGGISVYEKRFRGMDIIEHSSHVMTLYGASNTQNVLVTTDLRCKSNDATFSTRSTSTSTCTPQYDTIWNASHAEYQNSDISISRILQHPHKPHTIYTSTSPSCRLYELDARMPLREVMVWSLPAATYGISPRNGWKYSHVASKQRGLQNDLLHMDAGSCAAFDGVFSVRQQSGSDLVLHQPANRTQPRFGARQLEGGVVSCSANSILAQNAVFALPNDYSDATNVCGLASHRVPLSKMMDGDTRRRAAGEWGYDESTMPKNVLCALTLATTGTVHCHALLECDRTEKRRSVRHDGLPAGARVLALPADYECEHVKDHRCCLGALDNGVEKKGTQVCLSNRYPTPGSAVLPSLRHRDNMRPFSTRSIASILSERSCSANKGDDNDDNDDVDASNVEMEVKRLLRFCQGSQLPTHPITLWELRARSSAASVVSSRNVDAADVPNISSARSSADANVLYVARQMNHDGAENIRRYNDGDNDSDSDTDDGYLRISSVEENRRFANLLHHSSDGITLDINNVKGENVDKGTSALDTNLRIPVEYSTIVYDKLPNVRTAPACNDTATQHSIFDDKQVSSMPENRTDLSLAMISTLEGMYWGDQGGVVKNDDEGVFQTAELSQQDSVATMDDRTGLAINFVRNTSSQSLQANVKSRKL